MSDTSAAYLYLLPALLVLGAVVLYPIGHTLWMSLHEQNLLGVDPSARFVGLEQYVELLGEPTFWASLLRTAVLTVATVALEVLVAMPIALLLNRKLRFRIVARSLLILPWALPTFVAAFLWSWMVHPQYGVVNQLLEAVGLIDEGVAWLGQPSTAMPTVIVAYIWKGFPWVALVLLAGLQAIDPAQLEAAQIDGAGAWRRFVHVVLPALRNVLIIVVVLRVIWTFNHFDLVYLMTGGGPLHATHVLPIDVYQQGFVAFRMGVAAAVGSLMLLVLVSFSLLYLKAVNREDEDL